MPAYTAPFGFQPVQLMGGQYYASSNQVFPIQSGYPTALRPGDLVRIGSSGYIVKETGTTTFTTNGGGILGVFLGCSYTDPVLGVTYRTNWTASTAPAANDQVAYVTTDPNLLFRVAYVSGTTVISSQTRVAVMGKNVAVVQNATSTTTSDIAVSGVNTTSTLPFKVLDVDLASIDSTGKYTAVICAINSAASFWTVATGATA